MGKTVAASKFSEWKGLDRQEARCKQHRFRKSPESYLIALEEKLIKESLPT